MRFEKLPPTPELKQCIECFWIVENNDSTPVLQKVIPDGFTEMIFHFGDPYKINLNDSWSQQPKNLLAGQITRFFYLENTGVTNIFGIKFKPAALTHCFKIEMGLLTNKVVKLSSALPQISVLESLIADCDSHEQRIKLIESELVMNCSLDSLPSAIDKAVEIILAKRGHLTVKEVCDAATVTERQLERLFKKYIGLSPKLYSRIVRFSGIFKVVNEKQMSWSEVGLETGFYDQSHFIKNFKAFTGEDPSRYFFGEPNLANFFLEK